MNNAAGWKIQQKVFVRKLGSQAYRIVSLEKNQVGVVKWEDNDTVAKGFIAYRDLLSTPEIVTTPLNEDYRTVEDLFGGDKEATTPPAPVVERPMTKQEVDTLAAAAEVDDLS